ncbi:TetR/AcrR family transcriptional regulator [Streptomyces sp. NBC_00988]|uniref:TetR/AcrR family transcriptional regulator n=1 Tax=Streptomyces sp. NBC_00988 TaxID=2903704 RepID=UPI003864F774|nr:TetR/AcrR family transcriptional regulator [Streptomyces sp. NBC_00988]
MHQPAPAPAPGSPPKPLRADAARNRAKLLAAATELFGERGLDAPLEEIARRAGVSIGTLYNHFPSREAFWEAIFPERLATLERVNEAALAAPDAWDGFVAYLEGLFALQAQDRGLNDALAQRFRAAGEVEKACNRGFRHAELIIQRARDSGQLRPDFEPEDLVTLIWAMSQVIRESMETAPDTWRRCLAFFLDGLRAGAAHPIEVPPLTQGQLGEVARSR